MRLPGLGPKTARRIWQELGVTTLDELKRGGRGRAAARRSPGLGAEDRGERSSRRSPRKKQEPSGPRALLGDGAARACSRSSRCCASIPPRDQVSEAGSVAPPQGDRPRPRHHRDRHRPGRADRALHAARRGSPRSSRKGDDEGDRGLERRASASTSASSRRSATATCSSTSPARRTTTSRCARTRVRRGLSVSEYGDHRTSRRGEVLHGRDRGGALRAPRLRVHPARAARERGRARGGARRASCRELVELGDLRGDLHTHSTWSAGRQELDRGDGARGARRAATRTSRSPTTRTTCATGGSRRRARRSTRSTSGSRRFKLLQGRRGQHPGRRLARRRRRGARRARLGDGLGPLRASTSDPTERVLAAMENPHVDCIGHLTGRKINRREPADVDLERVIEKALETGTFLEINSQPDRLDLRDAHARAGRRGGREDRDLERRAPDRRARRTSSSASRRRAARG